MTKCRTQDHRLTNRISFITIMIGFVFFITYFISPVRNDTWAWLATIFIMSGGFIGMLFWDVVYLIKGE
jgi:heme A synthase